MVLSGITERRATPRSGCCDTSHPFNVLADGNGSAADERIELLSVVMHELRHMLGMAHSDHPDDLWFASLAADERKRLSPWDVDRLLAGLGN